MTATNAYIRAYQTQEEQTLIVNGETSWDITPAVGLRSIIHFMLDIAAENTDDWPLPSSPWTRNEDQAPNGALRLLAEVRDPGTSQQTVSIPAAATRDPDTLKTLMIFDLDSEDWKDETTARIRYQALRENTQIPDNVPSSWGHPHHAIEISPGIQWVYAENESGIMLSPERWNELPPEVQDTISDPRSARAWPESCIVSALLELESCSDYDLESAIITAMNTRQYAPALPHLQKIAGPTHFHVVASWNGYTTEPLFTSDSPRDATAFTLDPVNAWAHRQIEITRCRRACPWSREQRAKYQTERVSDENRR